MCSKGPVFLGVFFALFLTAGRALAQLGGLGESAVSTGGATGGGPAVEYLAAWETDAVHPGSSARLALRFMLSEGWHVNAHTPLDEFLIGTLLSFEEQPNFQITQVVYPEAKLFSFQFSPDTKVAVYEREFFLGATVSIADGTPPGDYVLKGQLRYQACNDTQCAPPKNLSISVPVKVVPASQALLPQQEDILDKVNWESGTSLDAASAPRPPETPAPEVIAPGNAAGTPRFQDWKTLADSFEVVNRTAYVSTEDFLAFIKAAESGQATAGDSGLAHKSWWLIMGIVLGGGLLLNLTPCVLPLIPINIAIIGAGARAGSRTRGFLLGGAYGAGIALVYGALGLVVVLGLSNAFGAINATIWFNAGIALLFLVLALAMFDVVPIDFSKYQAKLGIRKNENGSFLIAAAMGAISALLAG
ncbi:MAG: hypothetical protein HYZ00_10480, partial [Candidatus Hydrogenedentes bacterium]|nr:hypothetical protein [Candidatus Hydrogenedentota bacterium]